MNPDPVPCGSACWLVAVPNCERTTARLVMFTTEAPACRYTAAALFPLRATFAAGAFCTPATSGRRVAVAAGPGLVADCAWRDPAGAVSSAQPGNTSAAAKTAGAMREID